jgi:hypothetical protein
MKLLAAVLLLGSLVGRPTSNALAPAKAAAMRLTTFHEIVALTAPAGPGIDYRFGFPGVIAGNRLFVGQSQLFTGVAASERPTASGTGRTRERSTSSVA